MPQFSIVYGSRSGYTDTTDKTQIPWDDTDCDDGGLLIGEGYPVFGGSLKAYLELNGFISFQDPSATEHTWEYDPTCASGYNMVLLGSQDCTACEPQWISYYWWEDSGTTFCARVNVWHYYNYAPAEASLPADVSYEVRLYENGYIEVTFLQHYGRDDTSGESDYHRFGWTNAAGDDCPDSTYIVFDRTYVFEPNGASWILHENYKVEIATDNYDLPQVSISSTGDYLEQGAMVVPQLQTEGTCTMEYHYSGETRTVNTTPYAANVVALSYVDQSLVDSATTTFASPTWKFITSVPCYVVALAEDSSVDVKWWAYYG